MDRSSTALSPEALTAVTFYTTREVAQLLRVSQRAVQVWIRTGVLPAIRYGRLLRVRHVDLAQFGEVLPKRTEAVGVVPDHT